MEVDLQTLRAELDAIDDSLVEALGKRFAICSRIAAFKKRQGIPMMQLDRIEVVKRRVEGLSKAKGIDAELIAGVYDLIIRQACVLETELMESISSGADRPEDSGTIIDPLLS